MGKPAGRARGKPACLTGSSKACPKTQGDLAGTLHTRRPEGRDRPWEDSSSYPPPTAGPIILNPTCVCII